MNREEICETVHKELDRFPLRKGKPGYDVPKNGLYFWYEKGETRQRGGQRATRVGTHKKANRLHARINEHFGSVPREGSVFRKHLGGALMRLNGEPKSEVEAWYRKRKGNPRFNDPRFRNYEKQVTDQAAVGNYRVLKIDGPNERSQLEEKLISLFSHCKHCRASGNWLGNYAYRKGIRDSGLCNVDHVCSVTEFAQSDLPRLKQLVDRTLRE